MADCDLIIRGGSVVGSEGVSAADVAVLDGRIWAVGPRLNLSALNEVDATGLHVFPGGVDSHVHFNEPGRSEWETIWDGSRAMAAGGYTTFIDMPLNNKPITIDKESLRAKVAALMAASLVDFGIWGGLVPGNLAQLKELVDCGVCGFKAFMCNSGIAEFPPLDDPALYSGMRVIAELDSILLLHAENATIVDTLAAEAVAEGRTGARDFARSRPAVAEQEAIARAIFWAAETRCRVHIVHVSTMKGALQVWEASRGGVDITCETCPHYLLYTEDDMERLGGLAKCAPPMRSAEDCAGLWQLLNDGTVPMVVSDHSPSTLDLKSGDNYFQLWGGVSGCQSTRQLLLAGDASAPRLTLTKVAAATSTNPARTFRLPMKGAVSPGFDADLWLVDLSVEETIRNEALLYRNRFSVHQGHAIRGRTVQTIARGATVFDGDRPRSGHRGHLIVPNRRPEAQGRQH